MLIFLDLETTGLEYEDAMCAIACVYQDDNEGKYFYELLNEGRKIPPKASSIHHITNEMIQESPSFLESEVYRFLNSHNHTENTLVGHNIKFDLEKLSNAGFDWQGEVIDTLRVTKHLIPECELFSLQVLRYELQLYKEEKQLQKRYGIKDALVAHHALSDAFVVELLYKHLLDYAPYTQQLELSKQNVLQEKFSFGKYEGRYIEEICLNDRGYVEWMVHTLKDLDEDMKYTLRYYLEG
jgi:DNA polymerase-3 subunit epsilon/exodeoxyribonuclease X